MITARRAQQELEFDLVVCGGGLAGVCAAVAAARSGVKVCLIQDRPVLGGNSSSEIRVVPLGCADSNAWTAETGIVNEIILENCATNHEHLFDHGMTNFQYDLVIFETVRREENITLLMNTSVRGVDTELVHDEGQVVPTRKIRAIHCSQLGTEKEFVIAGKQFIDATGDGTVGFLAGADWRYGREARSEFGEDLAPVAADRVTMGSTITMRARNVGYPVPFTPPPWVEVYKTAEEIGRHDRELLHLEKENYGGYWWLEIGWPYHQIDDADKLREALHRHVLGVWNYIKNYSPEKERAANYVLDWIGMVPGKRESRRLVGDVLLQEHHCHTDQKWPDGIAYAGWWIDLHNKGGILNKVDPGERENIDDNYKHWIRVAPFTIPLRSYYSRNVQNLWMAGRCLSVTHVALGPVRVMLSLGLQGQGVGTAAAYALRHGLTPRETADPEGPHVQRIRQQLLREDARIPGLRNEDPLDLARQATITATSEMPFSFGEPQHEKWLEIKRPLAQIVPITDTSIEEVQLYLRNTSPAENEITVELQRIERIWDRPDGEHVATRTVTLPGVWEGWVTVPMGVTVQPGPHRVIVHPAPQVQWAQAGPAPVGTVVQYRYDCPGGPEERNRHLPSFQPDEVNIPAYRHWWQIRRISLATRVTPNPHPFAASSVQNGCAWPEDMPNLWISDPSQPLPQSVVLEFPDIVEFNTVVAFFDTSLDRTTRQRPALWRAPECVRDWRLKARVDGEWRTVYEEHGNYQRRREVRFDTVRADALQLEVLATNAPDGIGPARLFELRVYNEE